MDKLSAKLLINAAGSIAGAVLEVAYIWAVCSFGESLYRFSVFAFIPRVISSLILSLTVWKGSRRKFGVGMVLYIVSGAMACALLMIVILFMMENFD